MRPAKTLIPVAAVAAFAMAAPRASAARINDCQYGISGACHNLTIRVVPRRQAKGFHGLTFRMYRWLEARIPAYPHAGRFPWREWTIRTSWYHDPVYHHIEGGDEQVDVRATASRGRVIRFQTAWD